VGLCPPLNLCEQFVRRNGKFVIELAFLFVQTGIWLAELSVSVSCVVLGRFDLALRANLLARLLY